MLKAIISRFENSCALVAQAQGGTFNGYMEAAAQCEDIGKMLTEPGSYAGAGAAVSASTEDGFWPESDSWVARYRPYNVSGGILTIPVQGALINGFGYTIGGFLTGYDYIRRAVMRGMADDDVKGIAFMINSPGGEVAGNFDLADYIYSMRDVKPMRAFAHEGAYSAAYSIASAAHHIAMSRSGGVGSIGVVTAHVDLSAAMEERGVKVTFIHFGKHKVDGNPYEELKADVKARMQERIDALGQQFVAIVARNRNMNEKAVRATEALTYSHSEAMSIGLADSVGPLEDAVAAFAAELSNTEGEEQMDETTAAAQQAAIDTARAEGVAQGIKEGAAAERVRISAIIGSDEGKKRPIAAQAAAMDTDMDVEKATAFLAKMPEEKQEAAAPAPTAKPSATNGQAFDAAMGQDAPNLGADGHQTEAPSRAAATASRLGWTK